MTEQEVHPMSDIQLQGESRQEGFQLINMTDSQSKGRGWDMLSQELIDNVRTDIEDIRFGTVPPHTYQTVEKFHIINIQEN